MAAWSGWRHWLGRGHGKTRPAAPHLHHPHDSPAAESPALPLDPDDPLVSHLQRGSGAVEVKTLRLDSAAVRQMTATDVELVVPLVSQGDVIGVLALGPRRGRQSYSAADRALLTSLAAQVAPAVRLAQLLDQQQAEVEARERMEQELRVAQLIQQTLLPKAVPDLPGWRLATAYRPARTVGGDFYDFIGLDQGRLGIIIADATSKGVPAALVMATTRSVLRATAAQFGSPGQVLARANELLCPDMPPNMFVTCLYAILDPAAGSLSVANAGHPLPFRRHAGDVAELRVTGVPLGLMADAHYEEREITLVPGESILFYSDGLVEAHDRQGEMFGIPRLRHVMERFESDDGTLIDHVLTQLGQFTAPGGEQEDDVTLVTLQRIAPDGARQRITSGADGNRWRVLARWDLASEPGNERLAMERVAATVHGLVIPPGRLERLKTAVGEATLNAMEHGNHYRSEIPVQLEVRVSETTLSVRVTDQGSGVSDVPPTVPDLEAKLAGHQSPRGWGLFLIKHLVDEMWVTRGAETQGNDVRVAGDGSHHTVELVVRLGDGDATRQSP